MLGDVFPLSSAGFDVSILLGLKICDANVRSEICQPITLYSVTSCDCNISREDFDLFTFDNTKTCLADDDGDNGHGQVRR